MPANRLTSKERSQAGRIGAHRSWANTENRSARTAPGRAKFEAKFLEAAGGDPLRAESLRRAHYAEMAFKSARARKRHSGGAA
ncbi:hypothetical protein MSS4_04654 [Mycobacterium marinum]|nr:hypothetical protein MSS4_04654 [Mycobacterium marinum]